MIIPPESFDAVSTESASLDRMDSCITRRSTTTSTVCFLFFSSFMLSDRSYIMPSTRTRTKPLLRAASISFACSPFLALTTGDRTIILVFSGSVSTLSTIWSTVCCFISRPHTGQCGTPMRAYSSLK